MSNYECKLIIITATNTVVIVIKSYMHEYAISVNPYFWNDWPHHLCNDASSSLATLPIAIRLYYNDACYSTPCLAVRPFCTVENQKKEFMRLVVLQILQCLCFHHNTLLICMYL